MMKRSVGMTLLACAYTLMPGAQAAHAQSVAPAPVASAPAAAQARNPFDEARVGLRAGTFLVRLRAIGVLPETRTSSVSVLGGHIDATDQAAPELDLSYFLTDHIAIEGIAASTRHEISVSGSALGHLDVGSVWVLPPTVTLQYHFFPHERVSPYLGVGLTVGFFYDTRPANPPVTKFALETNVGPAIEAGLDYNIFGHWFLNADVKQIFINTGGYLNNGAIHAKVALDPTVVGFGIGYRF